jgi:phosphotransferase system IIB component
MYVGSGRENVDKITKIDTRLQKGWQDHKKVDKITKR